MDVRQVFEDSAVKEEFLERFDELAGSARQDGGLEGMEVGPRKSEAEEVANNIQEGSFTAGDNPGLEAIIERFTRPVYLVQKATFEVPPDSFPDSEEIKSRVEGARQALEQAIPSAGRIDVRNHRLDWLGTAWMVGPGVAVTNRHVAEEFAEKGNGAFTFKRNPGGPAVSAVIDWKHEHQQADESRFSVKEVLWIEPPDSVDVALIRVSDEGESGDEQPAVIDLMTEDELSDDATGRWVAVVGYPAYDSRNDRADQQRIFDGIYNVKRLAPGKITSIEPADVLHHDATTLGGNSGSVIVDLSSGKAIGLHFGGIQRERNEAVQAPRVRQILDRHLN